MYKKIKEEEEKESKELEELKKKYHEIVKSQEPIKQPKEESIHNKANTHPSNNFVAAHKTIDSAINDKPATGEGVVLNGKTHLKRKSLSLLEPSTNKQCCIII